MLGFLSIYREGRVVSFFRFSFGYLFIFGSRGEVVVWLFRSFRFMLFKGYGGGLGNVCVLVIILS